MSLKGILNDYRHSPLQIVVDCNFFEHNKPEVSSSMVPFINSCPSLRRRKLVKIDDRKMNFTYFVGFLLPFFYGTNCSFQQWNMAIFRIESMQLAAMQAGEKTQQSLCDRLPEGTLL